MTSFGSTVSRQDYDSFHERGYVILRGVFDAREIAAASAEANRLLVEYADSIDARNLRVRYQPHARTKEPLFDVFDPVFDLSATLAALGRSERILGALSTLYGEPACQYKDKLIYRPPQADGIGLHQDWTSRPGFPASYTASIIAIDAFEDENGCTRVFPGVHKFGYLSPKDGGVHRLTLDRLPLKESVPLLLEPGDVAIFGGLMPHYSEPNLSNRYRRGLFTSYNAFSDGGEQREKHYEEVLPIRVSRLPEAERPFLYFR